MIFDNLTPKEKGEAFYEAGYECAIDRALEIIDDEITSWEQIRDELGCKPEEDNAEAALAIARSRISELMKEGEHE